MMQTKVIVLLISVVILHQSLTTSVKKVHNCSCQRNNNKYIQLAEKKCKKFTQYDNITGLTHTHSCPEGLRFSVETCVCEHGHEVACEGCGPLVCEIQGNTNFKEVIRLKAAGECQRGDQLSKDLLAVCVVKDPVRLTLLSIRYAAAAGKTVCPSFLPAEGCEQLNYCLTLMLGPENKSNSLGENSPPEFLCENYKEARSCLTCAENNGCKSAEIFRSNLRDATAELCPHIQEFICPADD